MRKLKKICVFFFMIFSVFMLGIGITPKSYKTNENVGTHTVSAANTETDQQEEQPEQTETNKASIGETKFETLQLALEGAQSGDTVKLLDNVVLGERLTFPNKDVNLDLNNFTITINASFILINSSTISVKIFNGKIVKTNAWENGPAVYVNGAKSFELSDVTIESDSIYGFYTGKNNIQSLNIKNCNITAKVYPICNQSESTTVISDCTLTTGRETSYTDASGAAKAVTPAGIRDQCNGHSTISNCQITSVKIGILAATNNTTEENEYTTKIIGGSITADDVCIEFQTKSKTLVSGVQLNGHAEPEATNNSFGIYIADANTKEVTIDSCTMTNLRHGIYNFNSAKTVINNCTITNFDVTGIFIKTGADTIVSNTTISTESTVPETIAVTGISNFGRGEGTVAGKVIVDNCNISCRDYGISGNGAVTTSSFVGRENTDITVNNTNIIAKCGIFHPQKGTLVINGGTINASLVGVEVRAGNVTINNNAVITVPSDVEYKAEDPDGEGTSTQGVALSISQHTTNLPINVTVNSATLSAARSLAQVDTRKQQIESDGETLSPVEVAVNNGTFHGEVEAERVTNFISGGNFDVQPSSEYTSDKYYVTHDGEDYYVVITEVERAKLEATEFAKLYASANNVKYTEEINAIINDDKITDVPSVDRARRTAIAKIDELAKTVLKDDEKATTMQLTTTYVMLAFALVFSLSTLVLVGILLLKNKKDDKNNNNR